MGYRSNVRCVIYTAEGDPEVEFAKLKTLLNTTFKPVFDAWYQHFVFVDPKYIVDFSCEDVKWYESYPDVDGFMRMLSELSELGYVWEFIRVGESSDDFECLTSGDDQGYLYTSTAIFADY